MAAKDHKKASESGLRSFYMILAAVVVVGLGALGYSVFGGSSATVDPVPIDDLMNDSQALLDAADGMVKGDPNAPVTVIEFGDFQCPACGVFAMQVKPYLDLEYIQTGKVKFVFYDFPLTGVHQNAFIASRAARCAGDQGRYWDYHDRLFSTRDEWALDNNPVDKYVGYAEALGMDAGAFEACVESDRHAEAVTASREIGSRMGVSATPTILVDGEPVADFRQYNLIKSMIEEALAARGADPS